jgi:hypothetical protein
MASRVTIAIFVIGLLLFVIGMGVYWAIPTEYVSSDGTITTGSSVGIILIFIGSIMMILGAFLVDI